MTTLLLIGVLIVLIFIKYKQFKRNHENYEKLINKIPGPKVYPLIGNMDLFLGTPKDIMKKTRRILEIGSPFRIWMLHKPFVTIFDPDNFQIVANKVLHKDFGYNFVKDLMGDGLITSTGEKWKKNRRILNPAFNPRLLLHHFWNTFRTENNELMNVLDEESEKGNEFNLWTHIINYTLNSITANAMQYKKDTENDYHRYGRSILKISRLVSVRVYKPWLHPQIFYDLYKKYRGYDKELENIYSLPKTVIEEKKKEIDFQQKFNDDDTCNGRIGKTFIDILLTDSKSKLQLSDSELTEEVVTFVSAGSETTALTMCSTLFMLAIHQNYQEQVYKEIQDVLGDCEELDIDHMNKLPFLDQCIKETMRRFPAVPILFRDTTENLELKNGEVIPPGTTIALLVGILHHNPKVYPNPYKWNPDNFSEKAVADRHPCHFVPFSFGPRSCIGAKYAMLTLKFTLVNLIRRYQFYSDYKMKDIKLTFDIMLRSVGGYPMRIKRRPT